MQFGSVKRSRRGRENVSVELCESRRLFAAAAVFTVINANDAGAGSLRQAIISANANLNNPGEHDEIRINISGPNHTIAIASALPAITDPVDLGKTSTG